MGKILYPKIIGLETNPLKGKHYAFRFSWKTTESISRESVERAFDALLSHFETTFKVSISSRILGIEGQLGAQFMFLMKEQLGILLKDMWDWLKFEGKERYLDLTLHNVAIYETRWPWWVWVLLAGGGIGTVVAIARRKK